MSMPASASQVYGEPVTPTTLPVPVPSSAAKLPQLAPNANNAAPGFFSVQPNYHGYYQYSISPGQTTPPASITVSNTTQTPQSYLIYPTYGITSLYTGLQYQQADPGGPANWVDMQPHVITLAPKQAETETFTVTVPNGVPAGDYVLAIVGQGPPNSSKANTTKKTTSASMIVTSRTIVADVIQVQGSVPSSTDMQVGKPTFTTQSNFRQVLNIPMREIGNRLTHPILNLSVNTCVNPAAKPYFLVSNRQLDTFVPFTSIVYPLALNNVVLPANCYVVSGTLSGAPFSSKINVTNKQANVNPAALLHPVQNQINQQNKLIHLLVMIIGGAIGLGILASLALFIIGRRKRKGGTVIIDLFADSIEADQQLLWTSFKSSAKGYEVITDNSALLILKKKSNTIVATVEIGQEEDGSEKHFMKVVCSDSPSFKLINEEKDKFIASKQQ
jgi:hypothetical protein